tara:strand:+ start:3615 stop:3821 length:207 start_codon:yes stop_codon:yes gene_type:complete
MTPILKALESQYKADIEKAKANIDVYINNAAGIGEHPDLVESVDTQIQKLTDAEDKLTTIRHFYGNEL